MKQTNPQKFQNSLQAGDRRDSDKAIYALSYAQSVGYGMVRFVTDCVKTSHESKEELELNRIY